MKGVIEPFGKWLFLRKNIKNRIFVKHKILNVQNRKNNCCVKEQELIKHL